MKDIPRYETFTKIKPIDKGLSSDKKYYIETDQGEHLLLRVSNILEYNRKKMEFDMMQRVCALGVPMSQPLEFGTFNEGKNIYSLLTWCEGNDAEEMLPTLTSTKQYELGLKAGVVLKKIHTLPAPTNVEPWNKRFKNKLQGRIEFLNSYPIKFAGVELLMHYLEQNQNHLDQRPQCFNHGDYSLSNLIVTPSFEIGVIDFNYYNADYGDPWWEFCAFAWGSDATPYFQTGVINGYFLNTPPMEFFQLLAYYFAYGALAGLCETIEIDDAAQEDGIKHLHNVLSWFDNMKNIIPSWYIKVL